MRKSSLTLSTAQGIALLRAVETARKPADRLFADPYARRFIDTPRYLVSAPFIRGGIMDRLVFGGMVEFSLLREVHVGAEMEKALAAGAGQVVILGAGYDTRAWRLPAARSVPVFEVDHPITQAGKKRATAGLGDVLPPRHVFVAVDFDHDDLGTRLAEAGYRADIETVFVWQGVTFYLTPEGVDATLAFVGRQAPGGTLIFDYMDSAALARADMQPMLRALVVMGERMKFGAPREGLADWLGKRGFTAIESIGGEALKRRYAKGIHLRRRVAEGAHIATARIAGPGGD